LSTDADTPLSPTIQLARALFQKPSVTPADHGCQALLSARLEPLGFTTETMRFGNVDNLWARRGERGPLFVFAGHTDVVPPGDESQWTYAPFSAELVDGMLYARGAADMKGSIASMVTAVERYLADYEPQGSMAFLITSDEEGPAINGTAKVIETLQARDEKIDWCIVGEPTSSTHLADTIKNGRRGSLSAHLSVYGKQGHVAYPHLADNPVHRALGALQQLTTMEWDKGNDFFPATTLQISNLQAGTGVGNVIPGDLNVMFNLRFSTELTVDEIKSRILRLLKEHRLNYDIEWSLSGLPFITEPGDLTQATQAAILAVCARQAKLDTGGGTSDGRFIAPTGAQVIELGPNNRTIHQINEHVSVDELETLSSIYQQTLQNLLGDTKKT